MEKQIETLCACIELRCNQLERNNVFAEYDGLEFDLLHLNTLLSKLEYDYEKLKLENSIEWSKKFNITRQKEKSDASTTRILEEQLSEIIFKEKSQKNIVEMYNKLQKGYIRIAEHIKSKFIREMADKKRQTMVENIQEQIYFKEKNNEHNNSTVIKENRYL